MLIIHGLRWYGRVLGFDKEYVATRFVHLYFLPLVPVGSMWVMGEEEKRDGWKTETELRGLELSFHPLSILVAYLRTWGLLVALILCVQEMYLWAAALLGLVLSSFVWASASSQQQARQRLFASVTGVRCDPDLLPQEMASELLLKLMGDWRAQYGGISPEELPPLKDPRDILLCYSVLRLMGRASNSKRARAQAEVLFTRHFAPAAPRPEPRPASRQDAAPAQPALEPALVPAPGPRRVLPVLEGTMGKFQATSGGAEGPVLLAWYRPDQWNRLRDVSADAEELPSTYAGWLAEASKVVERQPGDVRTVDVDVEELVLVANQAGGKVDRELRTGFVLQKNGRGV